MMSVGRFNVTDHQTDLVMFHIAYPSSLETPCYWQVGTQRSRQTRRFSGFRRGCLVAKGIQRRGPDGGVRRPRHPSTQGEMIRAPPSSDSATDLSLVCLAVADIRIEDTWFVSFEPPSRCQVSNIPDSKGLFSFWKLRQSRSRSRRTYSLHRCLSGPCKHRPISH